MRPQSIPAAVALAFAVFAPSLTAQAVRLPDSLKYTALPSDPADFPAKIKAGAHVYSLYSAGCPSDGGYAEAAHNALVKAAETDLEIRRAVTQDHGLMLNLGEGMGGCPADLPRFEALLTKWLREEWEAGLLDQAEIDKSFQNALAVEMFGMKLLAHAKDPATYQLLRSIARDPDVYVHRGSREGIEPDLRRDAARAMLAYRMNQGMGQAEAVEAVEADLAGATSVGGWRPPGLESPGS